MHGVCQKERKNGPPQEGSKHKGTSKKSCRVAALLLPSNFESFVLFLLVSKVPSPPEHSEAQQIHTSADSASRNGLTVMSKTKELKNQNRGRPLQTSIPPCNALFSFFNVNGFADWCLTADWLMLHFSPLHLPPFR